MSLLADSIDFLEDAAVNLLIVAAIGWSLRRRARVGMLLALLMLVPAAAFLWTLAGKLLHPVPPEPVALGVTGAGALAVNLGCALLLARHRHHGSEPGARRLPLGAQRRACQRRHRARRPAHRAAAVDLA